MLQHFQKLNIWPILRDTYSAWDKHEAPRQGAALAFYSLLSLAPLAVLVVAIVAIIFGKADAQAHIVGQVRDLVGSDGADAVQTMLKNARKPSSGILASSVGIATLLFGASGVFGELRASLNKIWEVGPDQHGGIWKSVTERLASFGMVLAVGFLLLVSLILSAGLAVIGKFFGEILPVPGAVATAINFIVSLAGTSLLFALIFRYVPEVRVPWKDVWLGAICTALFFTLGKTLIGLYLGKAAVGSPYGAAGSLVVMIVWVYYSSMIFLFGAEFTRVLERCPPKTA